MLTVEFGSRERGDFNISSDKDMLLIGNNLEDLFKEKEKRINNGHSVTCMTTAKAKHMVNHGSLFFKHIIDEGRLVEGSKNNFFEIIKNWKPAPSYQDEINANADLFELLSYLPKNQIGILTASDIVTISIRNILIRKFASHGLYIFSWEHISNTALQFNLIDLNEKNILLHSREIKNFYRQGYKIQISICFFESLLGILSKIMGEKIKFRFVKKSEILQLHEKFENGSYKQLRAIELLCAFYGFESCPKTFIKWIKDPNYFSVTQQNTKKRGKLTGGVCY